MTSRRGQTWQAETGEQILRDIAVDPEALKRLTARDPLREVFNLVLFGVPGVLVLLLNLGAMSADGLHAGNVTGFLFGVLLIAGAVIAVTHGRRLYAPVPGPPALYRFTDRRIIALDAQDRLIEQVETANLDGAFWNDDGFYLVRASDRPEQDPFELHPDCDLFELEGFVRDTYL